MQVARTDIIAQLQRQIMSLGGLRQASAMAPPGSGLRFMQAHFPNRSFPTAAVHELVCPAATEAAASSAFVLALLSKVLPAQGPTVWISRHQTVFPPALSGFGIPAHQLIFVHASSQKQMLWAIDEALKCEGLHALIAEPGAINFMQSRRFQLSVEQSRVTAFMLCQRQAMQNTCVSRWHIKPLPSVSQGGMPGVGPARWEVELQKMRNGRPGKWVVEWDGRHLKQVQEAAAEAARHLHRKTG